MSIASDTAAIFRDRAVTVPVRITHGGRSYSPRGTFGTADVYENADGLQVSVRRNVVVIARGAIGKPPADTLIVVDGARWRVLGVHNGAGDGATEVVTLGVAR